MSKDLMAFIFAGLVIVPSIILMFTIAYTIVFRIWYFKRRVKKIIDMFASTSKD